MKILILLLAILFAGCTDDEKALSTMKRPITVVAVHKGNNRSATVRDATGKFRFCQSWIGVQIAESYKVGDTLK
jgi:hypothetical protein